MADVFVDEEIEEDEDLCDNCGDSEDDCCCIICCCCGYKPSNFNLCSICEDACSLCCECCQNCGYSECECCCECESYPCCCDNDEDSFGQSDRPAWEGRGIKPESVAHNSTSDWQAIWPEIDAPNFDLCQQAADFYVLEAITNGLVNSPTPFVVTLTGASPEQLLVLIGVDDQRVMAQLESRRPIDEDKPNGPTPLERTLAGVVRDAKALYNRRIDTADGILRAYFHMACAGEARHHQAMKNRVLSTDRDRAWSGWRSIYDQIGPDALLDLASLFLEFGGGAYGGVPWAEACKILHAREMGTLGPNEFMNKKMFIDRAWTLEHNGGCFLNKIQWGQTNPIGWGMGSLKDKVLNSHASDPPNWRMLLKVASAEVGVLWDQVWEITNEINNTNNDNPRSTIGKMRYICMNCEADVTIGHFGTCRVKEHFDFDGIVEGRKDWYRSIDEDDWGDWPWGRWNRTEKEAFYGPDMEPRDPDMLIPVTFRPVINVTVEPKNLEDFQDMLYGSGLMSYNWQVYGGANNIELLVAASEIDGYPVNVTNWLAGLKPVVTKKAVAYWLDCCGITKGKKGKKLTEKDFRVTFTTATFTITHQLTQNKQVNNITDPFKKSKKDNKFTVSIKGGSKW